MRKSSFAVAVFIALGLLASCLHAQDKPKTQATTLKVQITIVEQDGDKKVTNLPYTFFLRADVSAWSPWTKIRTGSRVPVYTGKEGGMQYLDVGTNIDARVFANEDGRFDLALNVERSWVEGEVAIPVEKTGGGGTEAPLGHFKEPIIRQFKTELTLPMRDGQSTQSTQAADPGNGRLLTLTVTINAVK